tara:strand:- start:203 stop:2296 length:2094 start_codon:yes stop_codon:yes gene_type:complete
MAVRKIDVSATGVPTGYAKGQALESLDWSAISDQLDETMQAVESEKQAKKDQIKKQSEEIATTLNNAPLGNHKGRNDALLEYASNAQNAMLLLDQNLKNGNISLKDYTVSVQNLKDGTSQTFDIMEQWNKDYDEAMTRMQNCGGDTGIDCSAAQEQWQMMQAEGLGKLENHALYINPTNFRVTLGKREVDENGNYTGGISKNQNDFAEVQQLRNRVKQRINKYDLQTNLDDIEGHMSTMWTEYMRANPGYTVQDARQNPEYNAAKKNWIESKMTNAVDVGSMLMDFLRVNPNTGEPYRFEMDPEIAANDPNAILMINDPERPNSGLLVPDFSTENGQKQFDAAYDLIDTQLEGQLDKIEKPSGTEQKWKSDQTADKNVAEDYVSNIAKLWSGDNQTVQSVLSTIGGANPDIIDMYVGTDDQVYIVKKGEDGARDTITPIPRGDNPQEFVEAIITHISGGQDLTNLNKAVANSGLYKDMEKGTGVGDYRVESGANYPDFNTSSREGSEGTERPGDLLMVYDDMKYSSTTNAENMAQNLETALSFLPSGTYGNDGRVSQNTSDITYMDVNGNEVTIEGGDGDDGSITVFYPDVMTAPITIPSNTDSEKDKANVELFNKIMEDIYNTAATYGGEKIKPSDYANLFLEGDWEKFNNAELFMHLGFIDNAEQWSGGDGVVQPRSNRPNATNQNPSGDSMKDF